MQITGTPFAYQTAGKTVKENVTGSCGGQILFPPEHKQMKRNKQKTFPMTVSPKLIIFDLDGTLIDTMGGFADIAGELIAGNYGWSFERGRKRYLETSGIPFLQQLNLLFPQDERNAAVAAAFEKRKISSFTRESISEKTRETLHWLRDHGFRTAISSNNHHLLVKEFVHRENVPVDRCLGFKENFCKGRPHFEYLKDYFKIHLAEMLFVGDSLKDAEIAMSNRVSFVGKAGTFSEIDFKAISNSHYLPVISEIHEIVNLLEVK